jgi:hypothetical protein
LEKRRNILIKLSDGKEYLFSERNKEDSDFQALQDCLRKHNIRIIQASVTDSEERLVLYMIEMKRQYTLEDTVLYISSSTAELKNVAYNSFKIENPDIPIEEFKKILPEDELNNILNIIYKLEDDETNTESSSEKKKKKRLFHQR